jgi:hypothetical protein
MTYVYLANVIRDFTLYIKFRDGTALSLYDIPKIALTRWVNTVENWDLTIRPQILAQAQGNDVALENVKLFDNQVLVQKREPNKNHNPFYTLTGIETYNFVLDYQPISPLSSSEALILNEEQARVGGFTIQTFKDMSKHIKNEASKALQAIGLGDTDANLVTGYSTNEYKRDPLLADHDMIVNALQMADLIDSVIYDLRRQQDIQPNLNKAANNNISSSSIVKLDDFYKTAIAVPFVNSLEYMAEKLLGSRDKWFEIAQVNKLQPPYIDGVGSKVYLLNNGFDSFIRISSTYKDKAFVGNKVKIGSFAVKEEYRLIESVRINEDNTMTVSISGTPDMNKLLINHKPYIKLFALNTINEDSLVLVPQNIASLNAQPQPNSVELRRLDSALLEFGVDILRDEETGEILLGNNGDFQMAYGMTNVRQCINNLLKTAKNELPWHRNYGLSLTIGERFVNQNNMALAISASITSAILNDKRFSSARVIDIAITPIAIKIDMEVKIKNYSAPIPLSYVG